MTGSTGSSGSSGSDLAGNLSGLTDANGRFGVLAIDHRDSLRTFLRPDDPSSLTPDEITALKIELIAAVAPAATGVMLEPEYSIPQVIDAGVLPPGVGFTAALEAQGYSEDLGSRPTTVLDGWSPAAALRSGSSCAKLLLPFHPDRPLADDQVGMAEMVVADCRAAGIPVVLEPLFYDLDDPADRPRVVIETASRFIQLNPDLLKLPFPVDATVDTDTDHWAATCRTISSLAHMPWVMLSGGGDFDLYARQLEVALAAGCSGFMVGRALWGDALRAPGPDRHGLLIDQVLPRMQQLRGLLG